MMFQQAYERLETIYNLLQQDKLIDIDEIVKLQNESKKLYDFCNEIIKKKSENGK